MGNPNFFNQVLIENNLRQSLLRDISLKLFKSIDSTNNQAKEFVQRSLDQKNESKDLIIFAADSQLTGRGRRGHNWLSSDPASIAVSFLFQAKNNIDQIPQITAAAALAVKETFKIFDLETNLKWPNDILVDNKKICGILSELVFNAQKDTFVIIGCGINLNNTEFSSEIKKIATSYYLEKNKRIDKNIFLAKLIEQLNFYIKNYLIGSREMILASWKKELDLVGKKLDFEFKNKKYTGIIRDILDSGELLVAFEDGQNKKLQSVNTSLDYQSLDKYNND